MAFYFSPRAHHPLVNDLNIHHDRHQTVAGTESGLSVLTPQDSHPLSSSLDADQEWVVFSPQLLSSEGEPQDIEEVNELEATGISTPLAFPAHNGSGLFLADSSELTDRVNAWRLDQSQLVFQEMQRLERKFFIATSRASEHDTKETTKSEGGSFWDNLTRRVMRDFIGLNDEVLEVIFGERLVSVDDKVQEEVVDHEKEVYFHFDQSLLTGPLNWDTKLIARLFRELKLPTPTEISILRYLGTRLLALTHPESPSRNTFHAENSLYLLDRTYSGNYWEDSTVSSNYWDRESSVSTPVW
jgi:hypothetical protein